MKSKMGKIIMVVMMTVGLTLGLGTPTVPAVVYAPAETETITMDEQLVPNEQKEPIKMERKLPPDRLEEPKQPQPSKEFVDRIEIGVSSEEKSAHLDLPTSAEVVEEGIAPQVVPEVQVEPEVQIESEAQTVPEVQAEPEAVAETSDDAAAYVTIGEPPLPPEEPKWFLNEPPLPPEEEILIPAVEFTEERCYEDVEPVDGSDTADESID